MRSIAIAVLTAALAACSTGESITPVDTAKLVGANTEESIKAALAGPGIGLTDITVGSASATGRLWITGNWKASPSSQQDWETIGSNAYQVARELFKANPPEKLVINLARPDDASLTQFIFAPVNPDELKIKGASIAKAIVKAPVNSADMSPFCAYLAGYDATGATSPAYSRCK